MAKKIPTSFMDGPLSEFALCEDLVYVALSRDILQSIVSDKTGNQYFQTGCLTFESCTIKLCYLFTSIANQYKVYLIGHEKGCPMIFEQRIVTFLQKLLSEICAFQRLFKVEKILKGSLDLIPSPSPSVQIQIMGGKVCLRCKTKTV